MKTFMKAVVVLGGLVILGSLALAGLLFYISLDLPKVNSLFDYKPPMNSKIISRDGEVLLEIGVETRDVVAFEKIPQLIVGAFLAAEDDNFFNHSGIDYLGILRAFIVNLQAGKLVQGGSTITQQVAKSFLLSKERTISRKIKDLLLAIRIEEKFSKEEILFLYLNQVYLGGGYYGVKSAFRGYFDKELDEATPAEAALVAGLLVAPGRYSPYVSTEYAKRRQRYVLKRMYETEKISKQEYEKSLNENIKLRIRKANEIKAGYFTDWIRQEVMKSVGVDEFLNNGFKVTTSLNWRLQSKAEQIVVKRIKQLDKRQGFRGPIQRFESEEVKNTFIEDQRKKILRDESTFFTMTSEGKSIFEYQDDSELLGETDSYFNEAKLKIDKRYRKLVEVGNSIDNKFIKFIKKGNSFKAVVEKVNDLKRVVIANIAGVRIVLPEKGFSWAHERKSTDDPVWYSPVKFPSKILKKGDVILVKIEGGLKPYDELINPGFFKRYTTKELREILRKQLFIEGSLDQEPEVEGALIALNTSTGEILSMVGGVDFQRSQFNRTLQSLRQPGSAFKPFIYAAALENGYTPSSILIDSPQALAGADASLSWKPRNYDNEFKGPMTLRNALEVSRNIPTVKLVQDLGVSKIHDFISRFHIDAEIPKDMSLALGSFGISLAELTKAYAVFPNRGKAIRLNHILSIKDRDGNDYPIPPADQSWPQTQIPMNKLGTDESNEYRSENNLFTTNLNDTQVYDPRLAYLMTNLLNGVTRYGTGRSASTVSDFIGGKTGTTNNYVDALFVGFSQNLVLGTWVGFDDNRSLGYGETGGKTALPMWKDFMADAIATYGDPEFIVPDGITSLLINKMTGKPLSSGSGEGFLESFVSGFDPISEKQTSVNSASTEENKSPIILDAAEYWEGQ